jgi:hypothetical protein
MADRAKLGMAIVLVLSVITIFISPVVDLQPTALRALQLANMLCAVLALAGAVLATLFSRVIPFATILEPDCGLLPAPDLVDLNCTRLC